MKQIAFISLFIIMTVLTTFAQDKYLEKGDAYLDNNEFDKAEKVFREAIKSDSTNLIYRSQLGLTLLQMERFSEAEQELNKVLIVDSNYLAAIWYSGLCNFHSKNYKQSILRFEKVITLIDKNRGQYYSANWFIGNCYSILLKTDGLSYSETDRMFECFEEYLRLQPNAKDANSIREYVDRKKKRRPPSNVEKWYDL